MKRIIGILGLFICILFLGACSNLPMDPTKTPTMTDEELIQAAQAAKETAEGFVHATETQWAFENPTNTPEPTETPTAVPTVGPAPTATEKPLNYYSVGNKSYLVYKVGDTDYSRTTFVPMDTLYVEVCYENTGSAVWNTGFRCEVNRQNGAGINPVDVALSHDVGNGEKACFSFQNYNPEQSLGTHCPEFALYTDAGFVIANGYTSACWTIQ